MTKISLSVSGAYVLNGMQTKLTGTIYSLDMLSLGDGTTTLSNAIIYKVVENYEKKSFPQQFFISFRPRTP